MLVVAFSRQSRRIAIAHAANRMTSRPTMTAFVSAARLAMPMTQNEITIQMPSRMFTISSQTCGTDTANAENTTIATPRIQAFHDAPLSVPAKPITHGEMNSQMPISRLSQSCQRFSLITLTSDYQVIVGRSDDSRIPSPRTQAQKNLATFTTTSDWLQLRSPFNGAERIRALRVLLAGDEQLGGDRDGDRAGMLARDGDRGSDRAADARERVGEAARGEPAFELRAFGLGPDQADVRPVVSRERGFDERKVERVTVRRDHDERAGRRVRHLLVGRVGCDDFDVRRHAGRKVRCTLVDPAHLRRHD